MVHHQENNRAYGRLEVVEPPKRSVASSAIKDALTREDAGHMSYGLLGSAGIGNIDRGYYKTFVGFNLIDYPAGMEYIEASLSLKILGQSRENYTLSLYETGNNWSEQYIKGDYEPPVTSEKLATTQVSVGDTDVVFDLMHLVEYLLTGSKEKSFVIIAEGRNSAPLQVRTRETEDPPLMHMMYYDTPPNAAVVRWPASVLISVEKERDLRASVDIESSFVGKAIRTTALFEEKRGDESFNATATVYLTDQKEMKGSVFFEEKEQESLVSASSFMRGYRESAFESAAFFEEKDREVEGISASVSIKEYGKAECPITLTFPKKEAEKSFAASVALKGNGVDLLGAQAHFEEKHLHADGIAASAIVRVKAEKDLSAQAVFEKKEEGASLESHAFVRGYREKDLSATANIEKKEHVADLSVSVSIKTDAEAGIDAVVTIPRTEEEAALEAAFLIEEQAKEKEIEVHAFIQIPWAMQLPAYVNIVHFGDNDFEASVEMMHPDLDNYGFII